MTTPTYKLKLSFKERYLKTVKRHKPKTFRHTAIGFITTLSILVIFMY
ncbi:hypothetical protein HUG15_09935 [Salicibibacter cibarius]|uniref:Uncharacterized protein n=1 Tax=Salicibibacter cibarius TaxID=2743000 RepID=A0A7T7CBE8_9BACI|nr:hypothetical protein [Salicibibacter cibarius]QQK75857.1 hypothetical protein HUG15_09935 [Salicibibacter cibarius]